MRVSELHLEQLRDDPHGVHVCEPHVEQRELRLHPGEALGQRIAASNLDDRSAISEAQRASNRACRDVHLR